MYPQKAKQNLLIFTLNITLNLLTSKALISFSVFSFLFLSAFITSYQYFSKIPSSIVLISALFFCQDQIITLQANPYG